MEIQFSNPEHAFGGTHQLLGLIESIYATINDPSLWPAVMERISLAMQGESLALYATFPESSVPEILALREMPREIWNSFAQYYAAINPILVSAQRRLIPGQTWYSNHVITDAELERTECYADFYQPNDMHYCAGIQIPLEGLPAANLSCQRTKAMGAFEEQADIVCRTLNPHLQRALTLHYQFGTLQAQSLGWRSALDALDHAVFGLDSHSKVVLANRHAESIVQEGDALRLVNGKLLAVESHSNRRMQQAIDDAVVSGSNDGLSSGCSLLLHRQSGKPLLRMTVTPFRSPFVLGVPPVTALVFLSDPTMISLSRSALLRNLYGLTPAEGRFADMLLQGIEIREAADRLGITFETGRLHVKRILAKTGVSRQVELMRLMLSLPGEA